MGVKMKDNIDINYWKEYLNNFVKERNWSDFHNIKNLVMNLVGESAELMELFTWKNIKDSQEAHKTPELAAKIRHEIGDVLMTLIMLADEMDLNLGQVLREKVELTEKKYPVAAEN